MREVLFRGKCVDCGEWIEGYYVCLPLVNYNRKEHLITIAETGASWEIIPETISEYTGLTDKNGKKIFEGDICRFREWNNGDMCWIGKVHYEHQQFVISGEKNEECETPFTLMMSRFISENIEVIGNVYDNSELIGE